ncbi:hypothetical protein DWQ65_06485 [Treponema phagedenis]|uniref:Uncharacterized protein n=1 Tax=Treponema phagedenis TaxID=162 RepID=A0A0B7GZM8_TREPH|nr:hypothetical protein [Treponema phagedenis]EFW37635.1 hypothetical protein HMPREF9554_01826 [Treponema phagedenis F0421]NVP24473.1 hypothetical protein [Treponema phagedenis]QEJ95492.1 hypothetical protein FUT79_09955 [Treponema phagedenis]QEJ97767.1 hypothetical protein FUT82_06995 [Treponema phagedenis]QEK01344.1 hypothetical protein FUT84_09425 [Treponema phagedenis]
MNTECFYAIVLPGNLLSVLYEEQRLFQTLIESQFRKMPPFLKYEKRYDQSVLKISAPELRDGYLIRQCSMQGEKLSECFVLGFGGVHAEKLIKTMPELKAQSKVQNIFLPLQCSNWRLAKVELTHYGTYGICWKLREL